MAPRQTMSHSQEASALQLQAVVHHLPQLCSYDTQVPHLTEHDALPGNTAGPCVTDPAGTAPREYLGCQLEECQAGQALVRGGLRLPAAPSLHLAAGMLQHTRCSHLWPWPLTTTPLPARELGCALDVVEPVKLQGTSQQL